MGQPTKNGEGWDFEPIYEMRGRADYPDFYGLVASWGLAGEPVLSPLPFDLAHTIYVNILWITKTLGAREVIYNATLVNKLLREQKVYWASNEFDEASRNNIMVKGHDSQAFLDLETSNPWGWRWTKPNERFHKWISRQ